MDPLNPKIDVDFFAITDVGLVRKQNEDQYLIADLQIGARSLERRHDQWRLGGRGLLFAVCDGMGGAAAGEVASQMAVDTMFDELSTIEPGMTPMDFGAEIDHSIGLANQRIHQLACEDSSKKGMGTTVSAGAIYADQLFLAQVGDSRAYLFRQGKLHRVTKDQSLLERLLEEGAITEEHAANFTGKNVILQALGPSEQVLVDMKFITLREDDLVLLCSDGLHGVVSDERLEECLGKAASLEQAGHVLIKEAHNNGAPDNVTVIVFRVSGQDLKPPQAKESTQPKHVKYARAPVDKLTEQLERDLGTVYWINKLFFSRVFLLLYSVLLVAGIGYFGYSNRNTLKKFFSTKGLSAGMPTLSGRIMISSDQKDAEVFVDKNSVGRLFNGETNLSLPTGTYRIYLKSKTWTSPIQTVQLKWEQVKFLEIHRDKQKGNNKASRLSHKEWLPGQDPR